MSIVRGLLNLTATVVFSFALAEILSKTDRKTLEEKVYKIDTTLPVLFRVIGLNYTDNCHLLDDTRNATACNTSNHTPTIRIGRSEEEF